jgi:hypothetical protein
MPATDTENLGELTDEAIADAYDRHAKIVADAATEFGLYAQERFRRLMVGYYPDASKVTFSTDTWENGVFLTIDEIVGADGTPVDEPYAHEGDKQLDGLLADLTDTLGVHAGDFDLTAPVKATT